MSELLSNYNFEILKPLSIYAIFVVFAIFTKNIFAKLFLSFSKYTLEKIYKKKFSFLSKINISMQVIYISTAIYYFVIKLFSIYPNLEISNNDINTIYRIILICCITHIMYKLTPHILEDFVFRNNKNAHLMYTFVINTLRITIVALSAIIILSEIGINVTAFITGLGLGGLTFALAAKDTATNIFGGIVIITDKQFDVGDWIQVENIEGIVESINFRSTRIRTFDDSISIFPNSLLANSIIINWSKMNKRKIDFSFGINQSTNFDDLKNIVSNIKEYVSNHSDIIKNSVVVRFDEITDRSLNIRVRAFSSKLSFAEIKEIKEDINYEIIKIIKKNNSDFVYSNIRLLNDFTNNK